MIMARIIAKLKKINADRVYMRVYLSLLKRRLNLSSFYIRAFLVFFFFLFLFKSKSN